VIRGEGPENVSHWRFVQPQFHDLNVRLFGLERALLARMGTILIVLIVLLLLGAAADIIMAGPK
jgi:hypothetical protein